MHLLCFGFVICSQESPSYALSARLNWGDVLLWSSTSVSHFSLPEMTLNWVKTDWILGNNFWTWCVIFTAGWWLTTGIRTIYFKHKTNVSFFSYLPSLQDLTWLTKTGHYLSFSSDSCVVLSSFSPTGVWADVPVASQKQFVLSQLKDKFLSSCVLLPAPLLLCLWCCLWCEFWWKSNFKGSRNPP